MEIIRIQENLLVFKGDDSPRRIYLTELSKDITNKIEEKYSVIQLIKTCVDYFVNQFERICQSELSVKFYQQIFKFHEYATHIAWHENDDSLKEYNLDFKYLAKYRRILKFILEQGCDVKMHNKERMSYAFQTRVSEQLNKLIFLGEQILVFVSLYAEETMVNKSVSIEIDNEGLINVKRDFKYEFILKKIEEKIGNQIQKDVVDDSELAGLNDFKDHVRKSLKVNYDDVGNLIAEIHEYNKEKGGDVVGVKFQDLVDNLNRLYGTDKIDANTFFQGLLLDRSNKMILLDLACKPNSIKRYLYKPIITWNIENEDYVLIGKNAWAETILQFVTNGIPWGKAPDIWLENKDFRKYVHSKEDAHDKWLDDTVEQKLIESDIYYNRNVKSINGINVDIKGLGEIDFLAVSPTLRKVFIIECKHLMTRFDIPNQKNDYNAFTSGKKPFNETLKRKVQWCSENLKNIEDHMKNHNLDISDYDVEGVFVVNTPTIYMYNSEFRIYEISKLTEVLNGTYEDEKYNIINVDDGTMVELTYPYFTNALDSSFEDIFNV